MKFLCVSDIVDPLIYSTSVKERYSDIDAIICAGDLSMEYQDFIVTALNKPMFFVFGNHDLKDFYMYSKKSTRIPQSSNVTAMQAMEKAHGGDYISNRSIAYKNLSFTLPDGKRTPLLIAGVSGSMRRPRFDPRLGRSSGGGHGNPLQYSLCSLQQHIYRSENRGNVFI